MVSNERATVFIHTNDRQMLGALVSQYSMKRNATNPDEFDVHLIDHADHEFFEDYEDREYLRDGASRSCVARGRVQKGSRAFSRRV